MDIASLDLFTYVNPLCVGICLCVGYVIKHSVPQVANKLIPLIMAVLGVAIMMGVNAPFASAQDIVVAVYGGMVSGLCSTGLHQAFSKIIGGDENIADVDDGGEG